jgi:cob(I)alamin adenosyltransferase
MKIYTRSGDDGYTSLRGGRRVPKSHAHIEALGSMDELIAWIGLLRSYKENENRNAILVYIQDQLMSSAASLTYDVENPTGNQVLPDADCITRLEQEIDRMDASLPELKSFILPGGNIVVSHCHIARCVCRRTESAIIRLYDSEYLPRIITEFLNRLSDYLFVLARLISLELDNEEIKWSR